MYHSPIPLVVIRADAEALVCVNGLPIGETGEGRFCASPVSDTGDYYISVQPLSPGRCPITRKLSFLEGELTAEPEDFDLCLWPGGVCEAEFALGRCEKRAYADPYTIASLRHNGRTYTLYYEEGLRLCAEREGRVECAYALGEGRGGALYPLQHGLCVVGRGERERLLILDGECEVAVDAYADGAGVEKGVPYALEALGTRMGHQRRRRFPYNGAAYAPEPPQTGFFTREYRPPKDKQSLAIAFAEAVREGFEEEAMGYLCGSLREDMNFEAIREFLGPFAAARPPLSDSTGRYLGLIGQKNGRISAARLYEFEYEGDKISNILEE